MSYCWFTFLLIRKIDFTNWVAGSTFFLEILVYHWFDRVFIYQGALNMVGINKEDQEHAFELISAVLWLGDISFHVVDNENHIEVVADEGKLNITLHFCVFCLLIACLNSIWFPLKKIRFLSCIRGEKLYFRWNSVRKIIGHLVCWVRWCEMIYSSISLTTACWYKK